MTSAQVRHNVQESGLAAGQPIVFAHGYGCDQSMWRYVIPEFEADFRAIGFDHLGFGGSDVDAWDPDRYASLEAYAADLLRLLHELDLDDVVYVGHSVASMIGVLAAVQEPERFARLVLVGPSPRYLDDPVDGYVGGFGAADIDGLLEMLEHNHLGWAATMAPTIMGNPERPELSHELEASFCRTDPRVAKAFARATFLADNRADLDEVVTPTLVLQCDQDVIAPRVVGDYVHAHIAGSELVQLAATGHCPNLSAPAELAAVIRKYLEQG